MKVLVVDDDAANRHLASLMLHHLTGSDPITAPDGLACLALADGQVFDAILLDVCMPGMDGLAVCKALRGRPVYRDGLIIACTAHAGRAEQARHLAAGFSSVLTKPFLLDDLARALAPGGNVPAACR